MDKIIAAYPAEIDSDLILCVGNGVAYERDMRGSSVLYDADYLKRLQAYDPRIEAEVVRGRCSLLARHALLPAAVLDMGCGAGAFMRSAEAAGYDVYGFDVIPEIAGGLCEAGRYSDNAGLFDAVTFWDSLEHMQDPGEFLDAARPGAVVLVSIPVFDDLRRIRESKHYRPREHLYYWTVEGFVSWMSMQQFKLLEISWHEVSAGRESIAAFAFKRLTH